MQNEMPMMISRLKSKMEVEFQYDGRSFSIPAVVITQPWLEISLQSAGCQIHMKLDALMQTDIPMTSGRSNNFKKEVELFQCGSILFHNAGTGFVQYYVSLTFSRKTTNINVKNSFYKNI